MVWQLIIFRWVPALPQQTSPCNSTEGERDAEFQGLDSPSAVQWLTAFTSIRPSLVKKSLTAHTAFRIYSSTIEHTLVKPTNFCSNLPCHQRTTSSTGTTCTAVTSAWAWWSFWEAWRQKWMQGYLSVGWSALAAHCWALSPANSTASTLCQLWFSPHILQHTVTCKQHSIYTLSAVVFTTHLTTHCHLQTPQHLHSVSCGFHHTSYNTLSPANSTASTLCQPLFSPHILQHTRSPADDRDTFPDMSFKQAGQTNKVRHTDFFHKQGSF